jgi:hypothetical protein
MRLIATTFSSRFRSSKAPWPALTAQGILDRSARPAARLGANWPRTGRELAANRPRTGREQGGRARVDGAGEDREAISMA